MKKLIAAIQFMTVLPFGKSGTYDPVGMIEFFPLVGLLLGGMVSVFDLMMLNIWSPTVVALLDIILLIVLTGSLHLDGLADTADGLYGNRPKEKALAIMKDSRVGAMGLVAVFCGLSVKWAGLAEIFDHRSLLILIIPAYARGAMLFGIRFLEYGRPEGGTGHGVFAEKLPLSSFWGLLIPVALSFFMGWGAVVLNLGFVVIISVTLGFYRRRIGCITGDMLGALTEITEAGLFLLAAARWGMAG
jgi:adenosylcobinamide-GDP ribazoletransferase